MTQDTINHHLTEDLLADYATGVLDEAFALAVATHVSLCDECRARLGALEALGGSVLETAGAVAMDEGSLDAVFARIAGGPGDTKPRRSAGVLPAPLQDYVGGDLAAVRWRPVGMGVRQAILRTCGTGRARLLYIPAGVAVPDHGHNGRELTLVLQGAFRDEDGRFARGDVECADEAVEHTPVAELGEDCICLAVTDAPLKFRRLIHKVAQPFLRI
ncbi:ChrR family anti-sigma-E factor [Phaeovulum sp. NW3]|uniref:ChrR family anti-sigma-E factor n=1 Tax=Phaeovulum sp. NW3 TaxID=2934933 RepID=UPI002020ADDC|nr:ChrR family anti-sigma-E factor [Phaeovulum sp. NW3]MCL7464132.1 ChrR family anti-sigma-E factor [Phaeovulum sp. NW3]